MKTDAKLIRMAIAWGMALAVMVGPLSSLRADASDQAFYHVVPQPRSVGAVRFRTWHETLALPETQVEVVAVRDAFTAERLSRLTERFEMRRSDDSSILQWAARAAAESEISGRERHDAERGAFDGWISDFATRQERYGDQAVWDEALSGRALAAPGRERSWGWLADDVMRHERDQADRNGFDVFGNESTAGDRSGGFGDAESLRPGWHPGGAGRMYGPDGGSETLPFAEWR